MAKPLPWSFSSLDTFTTCARKYHEQYVRKSVHEDQTEMQLYGLRVHKAFEDRQGPAKEPLPADMTIHEPYMQKLDALLPGGEVKVERRVALDIDLKPCGFFDKKPDGTSKVWWRGVIDYEKSNGPKRHVVDYKTGKQHSKLLQVQLFCLYEFLDGAEEVTAEYYWTQTKQVTPVTMKRSQVGNILMLVRPDLLRYKQAFNEDLWPPRQNGLCGKYCGVTDCEFHGGGMRRGR